MKNELKEMYSKITDSELLERYSNIDTYFEEAKEVIIEELIKRNLKTREEITERFERIEEEKRQHEKEKAEMELENKKISIERKKEFKSKLKSKLKKTALAAAITGLLLSSPFMLIKYDRWQKMRGMKKYLEEKYGQDFVVENLKSKWNTAYMTVILSADAHLKSNKEVDFTVIKEPKLYRDTYLRTLWSWQGRKKLEEEVCEIYGKGNYHVRVVDADIRWRSKKVNNLSYDDIIREYNDIAEVSIWMASFTDKFDEKAEAEKAFELYQKIFVKNKVKFQDLGIEIVENNKREEYFKFVNSERIHDIKELYEEKTIKERIKVLYWYDSDKEGPKDVKDIIKNRYYFKNGGLYR